DRGRAEGRARDDARLRGHPRPPDVPSGGDPVQSAARADPAERSSEGGEGGGGQARAHSKRPPTQRQADETDRVQRGGGRRAGGTDLASEARGRGHLVPPEGNRRARGEPRADGGPRGPGGDRTPRAAPAADPRSSVFVLLASGRRELRQDGDVLSGGTDRGTARTRARVRRGALGLPGRSDAPPALEERQRGGRPPLPCHADPASLADELSDFLEPPGVHDV